MPDRGRATHGFLLDWTVPSLATAAQQNVASYLLGGPVSSHPRRRLPEDHHAQAPARPPPGPGPRLRGRLLRSQRRGPRPRHGRLARRRPDRRRRGLPEPGGAVAPLRTRPDPEPQRPGERRHLDQHDHLLPVAGLHRLQGGDAGGALHLLVGQDHGSRVRRGGRRERPRRRKRLLARPTGPAVTPSSRWTASSSAPT